jgi:hypothetical protein
MLVVLVSRAAVILPIVAFLLAWNPWPVSETPVASPSAPAQISVATPQPPTPAPETRPTPGPSPTPSPTPAPAPTPTSQPITAVRAPAPTARPPAPTPRPSPTPTPFPPPGAGSPVMIGAGNVCVMSGIGNARSTAALIKARPGATVFTLGDNSYESGTKAQFANCYAKTWGAFLSRTRPTVGNHEYLTRGAQPYFAYFGSKAGASGKGYYSYNLANNWHVVVLNSMCSQVGGCGAGSPQEKWLKADLAANRGKHVLAMWHVAEFSSGAHGNSSYYRAFWNDLYAAHADLILNGHDHDYERFGLQSPSGKADPNGIREFVVGTGGAPLWSMRTVKANSQVRNSKTHGVLQLTLGAHSYSWKFIPVAGKTFTDSGTQATHS